MRVSLTRKRIQALLDAADAAMAANPRVDRALYDARAWLLEELQRRTPSTQRSASGLRRVHPSDCKCPVHRPQLVRLKRDDVERAEKIVAWQRADPSTRGEHPDAGVRNRGSLGLATAYRMDAAHRDLGKRIREAGQR